ncbi:MAG: carbohydrate ABC transporter permease [Treponema sp.]|nr:carbohydrate ABC transporter permease [Treponema sp.]
MAQIEKKSVLLKILIFIFVLVLFVWIGLPFYWMFISSIKTPMEVGLIPPSYWPKAPLFSNYIDVWTAIPFLREMWNSFYITLLTIFISLALTSTTSYALSRFNFKGKNFVIGLFLFVQLVPLAVYLIPLYFTLLRLKLINKAWGLVICYGIIGIPYMALLLRSYFKNAYPLELEEAAIIDGCSRFGTFIRIGLPLTRTGLIAVSTMTGINTWKEFLFASIVLNKGSMRPVAVGIFDLVGEMGLSFTRMGIFMTACTLVCVPLIVAFIFVQRFIVDGISGGAVKG